MDQISEDVLVTKEFVWEAGCADLDWYCTSNTEAHTATNLVYLTNKTELIALMNEPAYEILKAKCDSLKKSLPLFVFHPASR